MTIGDKILSMRKARGWSQEELADRVGVTRQAISRWESNSAKPDADKIVDICDLFGVSADYLLRDQYAGEGELPQQAENSSILPRTSGVSAVQILGILMIISAILIFCALGIMSAVNPHIYVVDNVTYSGILGYIMGNRLWWLVIMDIAVLVIGIFLLVGLESIHSLFSVISEKSKKEGT